MTTAENSTTQSPTGTPGRSLLIGAMFLAIAIAPAAWQKTKAAEQNSSSVAGNSEESAVQNKRRPRQILLDVRVVTMKPRDRPKLGTWRTVTLRDDESAVSPSARAGCGKSGKPIEAQVLFAASDPLSTESLLAKMKALEESRCLRILANPQIILRDGDDVLLKSAHDEWFLMLGPQTARRCFIDGGELEAQMGPAVSMTAHIADGNDITITTASEISNYDPRRHVRNPDSEIVIQRSETYSITLKDGGTMAWVGLVQRAPKNERRSGLGGLPLIGGLFRGHQAAERAEETVIFVTAQLIPELPPAVMPAQQ